jgi:hypothetical protein
MDKKKRTNAERRDAFLVKLGAHIASVRREKNYTQDRLYLEAGFS